MDVEDPINPLADPAALEIAQLFTNLSVKGSFCVTGERCRSLLARDRRDILAALKPHCLGLHTNTHSQHPTTMEMLADVSYEDGCQLAFESERKGYASFMDAFDRPPSFWGGAGNTWSPEINYALNELGIRSYSYALTQVPNEAVHRFNGVMGLPQNLTIGETQWCDDILAAHRMEAVLDSVEASSAPWAGIFVGHPTRFRHVSYWDLGYNDGASPDPYPLTPPIDEAMYHRSLNNLRTFLMRLKRVADIVGVDDMMEMDWTFRDPTMEELEYFRLDTPRSIKGALRWPIHRSGLSAENIIAKTMALEGTLRMAEL
jgi:hypothetical protein